MSDSTERGAFAPDRLPDVGPARPAGGYTTFSSSPIRRSTTPRADTSPEEPAWWEVDAVAQLPDARRWRPGSVVNGHLPGLLRIALDEVSQPRTSRSSSRPPTDDLDDLLGDSRFGPDDAVPVWTDADTVRERSSWKDESGRDRSDRRAKRGKRNRLDRPDPRRGSGPR